MDVQLERSFARWARLVDEFHAECAPDLPALSLASGHPLAGPHAARDVAQLLEASDRDVAAIDAFHATFVKYFDDKESLLRRRDLASRYLKLELHFGSGARALLVKEIESTFSGLETLFDLARKRIRVVTFLRVFFSQRACPPQIERGQLLVDVLKAYQNGILIHVYPQWLPYFSCDEELHKSLLVRLGGAPAEDPSVLERAPYNGLKLARQLNAFFHRYAREGEWLCFGFLMGHYAGQQCDSATYAQISELVSAQRAAAERALESEFCDFVLSHPDRRAVSVLLTLGAPKYCEKMVHAQYGRLEKGMCLVTAEVLKAHLPVMPSAHIEPAVAYYVEHGLGGLLGGTFGCAFLLRALKRLEGSSPDCAHAFERSADAFLEALLHRLDELPPSAESNIAVPAIQGIINLTYHALSSSPDG